MACIAIPPFPALPSLDPFTLEPPALAVDVSVDLCCKVALLSVSVAIPLGAAVLAIPGASAVIAGINQALVVVDAYIDALPLECPRE